MTIEGDLTNVGMTKRGVLRVASSLGIGTGLTLMGVDVRAAFPVGDLDWKSTSGNRRGDLGKLIMVTLNPYTKLGGVVKGYADWRNIVISDARPSLVTWKSGARRVLRSIRIPYAAPDNIEKDATSSNVAEALIVGLSFDQAIPPTSTPAPDPRAWGALPASPETLDRLGSFIINSMQPKDESGTKWGSRAEGPTLSPLVLAGEDQDERPRWRFRGTEVSLEKLIEVPIVIQILNAAPTPDVPFLAKLIVGYEGGAAY